MCGIAGVFDPRHRRSVFEREKLVLRMGQALSHRGPDGWGTWHDEAGAVSFVHRRLSILDLSALGKQPMSSNCGRYVLTFNGEVYNFKELRLELEKLGHSFRGHSDTEVMLGAFSEWGIPRALERFSGMFAFAVWDLEQRTLTLARDRLGQKPLYYGQIGLDFVFGSELKAFQCVPGWNSLPVDQRALSSFIRYNYVPAPDSIYSGISKLLPGHSVTVVAQGDQVYVRKSVAFWSLAQALPSTRAREERWSEAAALSGLEAVLGKAVGSHLVSDVPVGAFLSGGIDSSVIVSIMKEQARNRVKTFTIGFEEDGFDEARYAKAVAKHLQTDHHELYVKSQDARDVIPSLAQIYDEPFADSSQIPTLLVARLARTEVTVGLSGDGGDEVFAGYNRYFYSQKMWSLENRAPLPLRRALAGALRSLPPSWLSFFSKRLLGVSWTLEQTLKAVSVLDCASPDELYLRLVSQNQNPASVLNHFVDPRSPGDAQTGPSASEIVMSQQYQDAKTYLPDDILTKVDRASMSEGLEVRVPFLDPAVLQYGWGLPHEFKMGKSGGKKLLKELLFKRLPRELVDRPKQGFAIPIGQWLRGPLRPWAEDLLDARRLKVEGVFNDRNVLSLWKSHLSGARNHTPELWGILMFQAWKRTKDLSGDSDHA
jgi:asparagine synthase (glutamine-hydrolysing)